LEQSNWVDIVIKVISNLGFPIFVAVYLMVRTDKILQEVRDVLISIRDMIDKTGVRQ